MIFSDVSAHLISGFTGLLASLAIAASLLLQGRKIIKRRSTEGIFVPTFYVAAFGYLSWVVRAYCAPSGTDWFMTIAFSLGLAISTFNIVVCVRYRSRQPET